MIEKKNNNIINYFNTNNLFINTPKENKDVCAWLGIFSLDPNIYLLCGTTNSILNTGNGLIYIGEINCQNGNIYYIDIPNSLGTSIYGPNYDDNTGIYTFVGSFLDYNQNTNGFIYQGTLNELYDKSNFIYPSINDYFDTNFFHSFSNNLFVGNSGNVNKNNDTASYIYDMTDLIKIKTVIKYPDSLTTTSYGILYNDSDIYTIVGGYSMTNVCINKIYAKNNIIPIGNAFIVDYDYKTNTFFNWTSINFGENLSHFEGISQNGNNTYSIIANVLDLKSSKVLSSHFLTISRNIKNEFIYNLSNSIKILYDSNGISISNAVSDNKVVGLYISDDNTKISYQAEIINTSKSNTFIKNIKKYEIIKFDNTFFGSNYVNYKNGIFTFLQNGKYFIGFNVYIENTTLPSIRLNVEYTNQKKKNNFIISQKSVDEIKIGTAYSLVLPCSFINKFTINDIIQIRNISDGSIIFMSNYITNTINGIFSIYKIG